MKNPVPTDGATTDKPNEPATADVATTVATPVVDERHPAHRHLDELEAKLNTLGSYAFGVLKPMIDEVRNSLP